MRSAQKSNRSRGRGNRKGGGGGGGNNINRVYDSAGPEGKVRGTPQQIIDKYLSLARDAQTSGDRVTAENFLQHAEHYQRILIQANAQQEQARKEAQESSGGRDDGQGENRDGDAAQGNAQQASAPQPAIGGMDMIDSEPAAEEPLIVDAAAQDTPTRKRNGNGRRRPAPEPAAEAAEPAPAPEAETGAQPEG